MFSFQPEEQDQKVTPEVGVFFDISQFGVAHIPLKYV